MISTKVILLTRLKQTVLLSFGVLLVLVMIANGSQAASLEQIRVSHSDTTTRVVLDLSEAAQFGTGSAANPNRYFVDLIDSDFDRALIDKLAALPRTTPFVASIRTGKPKPSDVRVVLDLAGQFDIETNLIRPSGDHGHRLVIDVIDPQRNTASSRGAAKAPIESKVVGAARQRTASGTADQMDDNASRSGSDAALAALDAPTAATQVAQYEPETPAEKDRVIVVDAGHGGKDPGAVGKNQTFEKDIVLAIAHYVASEVNQIPGYRALMTRTDDTYIPLRNRAEIARENHAYAFISIHADGAKRSSVRGSSVYSLTDGAKTNARTKKLAEHMNANDVVLGDSIGEENVNDRNLVDTLMALSTAKTQELGFDLGKAIMRELNLVTPAHIDKVEKANFRVLLAPGVPTILVETGFITNPQEEQLLRTRKHQKATARAIVKGLKQFLKENESKLTNAEGQEIRG